MIVLIGFMGAGKSTIGRLLAERLGLPFVDSDLVIEQRAGRPITEIFASDGEPAFRAFEHEVIVDLLTGPDAVLALGGGAAVHEGTRAALREHGQVVYLEIGFEEALNRVGGDRFRPLLADPALRERYETRLSIYADAADLTVPSGGRRAEAIALDVLRRLSEVAGVPEGTTSLLVSLTGGTYFAHVGEGLVDHVGVLLPELPHTRAVALVAATHEADVAARVTRSLTTRGWPVRTITVEDSQEAKTLETAARVLEEFAEAALHRDDLVVAVGGEALLELVGFAAATYNRGMPLAVVPTTLAAQADTAIGGKNSLNLRHGRNLVGSFHQPVVAVCDPELVTGRTGFDDGLAEIVKHALVTADPELTDLVTGSPAALLAGERDTLRAAISRSLALKADIVGRDEREQGDRVALHYGHTFANALGEKDGCPVAIGMMAAAHLAHRLGLADAALVERHRSLLRSLDLPCTAHLTMTELSEAWLRDKKFRDGVRFVLLPDVGRPVHGVTAPEEVVEQVLTDLRA